MPHRVMRVVNPNTPLDLFAVASATKAAEGRLALTGIGDGVMSNTDRGQLPIDDRRGRAPVSSWQPHGRGCAEHSIWTMVFFSVNARSTISHPELGQTGREL